MIAGQLGRVPTDPYSGNCDYGCDYRAGYGSDRAGNPGHDPPWKGGKQA